MISTHIYSNDEKLKVSILQMNWSDTYILSIAQGYEIKVDFYCPLKEMEELVNQINTEIKKYKTSQEE